MVQPFTLQAKDYNGENSFLFLGYVCVYIAVGIYLYFHDLHVCDGMCVSGSNENAMCVCLQAAELSFALCVIQLSPRTVFDPDIVSAWR